MRNVGKGQKLTSEIKKEFDADYEYTEHNRGLTTVIKRARDNYQNAIHKETYQRGLNRTSRVLQHLDTLWWDKDYKRESVYHKEKLREYKDKLAKEQAGRSQIPEPVKAKGKKRKRKIDKYVLFVESIPHGYKQGVNQDKLAKKLGISPRSLSDKAKANPGKLLKTQNGFYAVAPENEVVFKNKPPGKPKKNMDKSPG
jgi:hypothetical protein